MDVEELYRLLRAGHMQAQGIVDTLDVPVAVLDESFHVLNVNRAFRKMFKAKRGDTVGRLLFDLGNGQWNVPDLKVLLAAVVPKATAVIGYEITHDFPELGQRTMLVTARRLRGSGDNDTSIMVQFEDITMRRREEVTRDVLLTEARHRMRNVMALARALAAQTEVEGRSGAEYRDAFLGRFEALLNAQYLSDNDDTDFADVVARVFKPFDAGRVRVQPGPPAALTRAKVLPTSLVLHELMTNAIKYGALSNRVGMVHLSWHVDSTARGSVLNILWREVKGPPVVPPTRKGYGTRLIEFSSKDLQGTADMRYEPGGLHATLSVPLE